MRARANTRGTRDQGSAFVEERRRQYVDELMDDYVSWRESCAAVAVAYENWSCSDRPAKALAFSMYVAALDREEQAGLPTSEPSRWSRQRKRRATQLIA